MRKSLTNKATAVITMAAMLFSMAACGSQEAAPAATDTAQPEANTETATAEATTEAAAEATEAPSDEYDPYQVITDASGNPIDLGGMEIIIRDWWSSDEPAAPANDYEEALQEYRDWIQQTYNFTIKSQAFGDWGSTPTDFVDYATTGGDENYLFTLRDDPAITSAMANGLMYDLATLDCLDFNDIKFQRNKLHEQYSKGNSIYAMFAGYSEARTGVYFNKRLLKDAGIDPESLYDMQADGTWTWDKFEELMQKVQQDKDNDGTVDVWGLTLNEGNMTTAAVFSNGGSYIDKDASGKYVYNLESPETLEALEWTVNMFTNYDMPDPEGAEWDYYKEAFINGMAAFMVDDEYCATPGNFLEDMQDEVGFVMFPKGPKMNDYINVWTNNPIAIPACYDADKAWKIAFAWNLYTNAPSAEYLDYNGYLSTARNGIFDERAVDETVTMMTEKGTIAYHGMIPNLSLGSDFVWNIGPGVVVSEQVEAIRDTWKAYVDEANAQ
ncbi:ABC-type glycerol-3-phosphate transport system, substrate-binding protein [Butyrivibrio sp. Su6]|uniref:extracellular solute-binding protein n=1 Tax=Butyrivibrio sp. Su6 TaxID=1520810 RepID=UPI00089E2DCD|nr:extracellular solute-binding protein [Butyrivibrio sp. Su6]SEF57363.1 ABC-type glycerol-3-phosphate transport system, substrate-binding protein [Butyrivibrio sp. Su6]